MQAEISTVTSKGQLVIPASLRRRLGIRKGTRISFQKDGNRLILQPVTAEFIRSLKGSLRGRPSLMAVLRRERKRDRML